MGRRKKTDIEASAKVVEEFRRKPAITAPADGRHQMDIRLKPDGTPVLFTWYRGHAFEGWIGRESFGRLERDGVLSWDADGRPAIDASKARPAAIDDGPTYIGQGI